MSTTSSKRTAPPIVDSIAEVIGCTPMVRLQRAHRAVGIECEVLAKCEFLNPGGSVKDRIAKYLVDDAIATGRIAPGQDRIVEPTSGNTGIGLAMMGAARGLDVVILMPNKMSKEKQTALSVLGATTVRTPTHCAFDAPDSHITLSYKMQAEDTTGHTHVLDQYKNPANPLAHLEGTGQEIVDQTGGQVDAVICCAGTGGTITGIARAIKAQIPTCKVVGVDPKGSILGGDDGTSAPYQVEGIGYDFIPDVLDRSLVDLWIKTEDAESFLAARELQRLEGLLVGGSSGAALAGAAKAVKALGLPPTARIVIILPDGLRNYMTKFADDAWLVERGLPVPPKMAPRTTAPTDVPPDCDPTA